MIQVAVTLLDYHEVERFNDFLHALISAREPAAKPVATEVVALAAVPETTVKQTVEVKPSGQVVKKAEITDAALEKAITAYYREKGLGAAKDVLTKYGVSKVGDIPAERRAEAMKDLAVDGA